MTRWLEHRLPPLAIALGAAAVMRLLSGLPPRFDAPMAGRMLGALCMAVPAAACLLAGLASFLRAKTTINPHRPQGAARLVTTGVYRLSRNPMYAGLALFLAAWAAYLASLWALAGVAGFVLYMNRFQIAPEERALARLFGAEYEQYKAKVRRWL